MLGRERGASADLGKFKEKTIACYETHRHRPQTFNTSPILPSDLTTSTPPSHKSLHPPPSPCSYPPNHFPFVFTFPLPPPAPFPYSVPYLFPPTLTLIPPFHYPPLSLPPPKRIHPNLPRRPRNQTRPPPNPFRRLFRRVRSNNSSGSRLSHILLAALLRLVGRLRFGHNRRA
jgi:hypothetical protein